MSVQVEFVVVAETVVPVLDGGEDVVEQQLLAVVGVVGVDSLVLFSRRLLFGL